jgi:hypothetical protein
LAARPYNPLEKINLARSIETEVLKGEVLPLDKPPSIKGAGVYLIYYRGSFEAYSPLSIVNEISWEKPIYVGKAIPKGGRKGGMSNNAGQSDALERRLQKHAESIRAVSSLSISDFAVRFIVLDDIWIPLGENILIESFKPLWNLAVDGFGINDPGKGRNKQKKSPWDVLHPGRGYAAKLTGGVYDVAEVVGRIDDFFSGRKLRKLTAPTLALEEDDDEAMEDTGEV